MSKSHQFNFRADPEFVENVRTLASIRGESMSSFVLAAVEEKFEAEMKKKPTLKRLIKSVRKQQA